MMNEENTIRALVEDWAAAVHAGDLAGVLADHAPDIVMFDVPPPHEGVRGLDAYRDTWPPFFRWQAGGAVFEITSLEITAGDEVAFAHALLRCDDPHGLAAHPTRRLRLTLGLRKQDGRWLVTHEHHSFALEENPPNETEAAEEEIRALYRRWSAGTAAGDLDALMGEIAEDVVSYEHEGPLEYVGAAAVREVCARGLDVGAGARVALDTPGLSVLVRGDLAVGWGLDKVTVVPPDGPAAETWSRATRVFQRRDGRWLLIQQHLSFPIDPETGEGRLVARP